MTTDEKLKLADAARRELLGLVTDLTPLIDCKPEVQDRWLRVVDVVLSGASPLYNPDDVSFRSRVPLLERKAENQRMELRNLYGLRVRDALGLATLEAERDEVKRQRDETERQLIAETELRMGAQDALASAEIELADKSFYVREFAAVSKERDELKAEIASLRQVETRPVKVRWSVKHGEFADKMSAVVGANVATEIAANVLSLAAEHAVIDVPPGMPILRDLREIGVHAYLSQDSAKRENAGCLVDPMGAAASAIRDAVIAGMQRPAGMPSVDDVAAMLWNFDGPHGWDYSPEHCPVARREAQSILDFLAPWLREPVQQPDRRDPTDAEVEELARLLCTAYTSINNGCTITKFDDWPSVAQDGFRAEARAAFTHLNRVRPVYECKDCAKAEAEIRQWRNANDELVRRAAAARAALGDE